MGFIEPKQIQVNGLDDDLRHSLWNVCRHYWFLKPDDNYNITEADYLRNTPMHDIAFMLYRDFYKLPVDNIPNETDDFIEKQLYFFRHGEWHRVLSLVDFLHDQYIDGSDKQQRFVSDINFVLEREKSAYRFVGGALAPLSNKTETQEVERSLLKNGRFMVVSEHIKTALNLFSKRPQPDYRNSIKEAISAVEAAAKIVANSPKSILDDAIKK